MTALASRQNRPPIVALAALTVLFGLAFGALHGLVWSLVEGYPGQGLWRLTARRLVDSAAPCLLLSVPAAAVALGLSLVGERWRRDRGGASLVRRILFAMATLPAWVWAYFSWGESAPASRVVPQLFPQIERGLAVGLTLGAVLQLILFGWLATRLERSSTSRMRALTLGVSALLVGTVAVPLLADGWMRSAEAGQDHPNVLLVILDTVRADALSAYGNPRPTTPELDALAAEGLLFERFHSTSSWTVPSHASLFSGLYPLRHRASQEQLWLNSGIPTLAEILQDRGYQTWGATANPAASRLTNMQQGFETLEESWRKGKQHGERHANNRAFRRFLRRSSRDRPFFAFLNYVDAHFPYKPPAIAMRQVAEEGWNWNVKAGTVHWSRHYLNDGFDALHLEAIWRLYLAEVADLSRTIGSLVADLEKDGRLEETLLIVTSDHGEQFGQHGLVEHSFGLYRDTVRVPLIVRLPGGSRAGEVVSSPGQLLDLFPTILEACGIPSGDFEHQGVDLFAGTAGKERALFEEYYFPVWTLSRFGKGAIEGSGARLAPYLRRLRALEQDGFRFIWSSNGRHELYDLDADPQELENLLETEAEDERVARYLRLFEETVRRLGDGRDDPPLPDLSSVAPSLMDQLDEDTLDTLRSLGYVE